MVSDQTRNEVWQNLLDVSRLVRYYDALSAVHRRNHAIIRFVLLAAAAGGIASLLDLLPPIAQLAASGFIALVVAWDFASDYARKAAVLHTISLECGLLEIEWRDLWNDANNPDASDDEVRERNAHCRGESPARPGGRETPASARTAS